MHHFPNAMVDMPTPMSTNEAQDEGLFYGHVYHDTINHVARQRCPLHCTQARNISQPPGKQCTLWLPDFLSRTLVSLIRVVSSKS